jgi:uncharacterized protein YyaL (SSP411 family)
MANRLATETSPYLLQHAGNPVDWWPWGDEAFAAAREQDKPVLLSVGYSACHWCHVMAHESFEDETTAALLNELFIPIKVDREERPDVDAVYMQAVQAMTGQGGWPMTVFLTPDGRPYLGGTYFPPEDRHGMRGFPAILQAAADVYHRRRDEVDRAGEELTRILQVPRLRGEAEPDAGQLQTAAAVLVEQADLADGGFGTAPKFPHPAAIDLLLRRFRAADDIQAFEVASITLDAMARGGVYDQLGGGFHRYSVDGRWAVPHFEKMLYDTAQLVPVYLHGWQITKRDRWRRVVDESLEWMRREMLLPDGGFASSQDADSEGHEGRFFVWTRAEIAEVLEHPADVDLACHLYGVTPRGNFEDGATVLHIADPEQDLGEERVQEIRGRLFAAREARVHPGRDDKVLTAWNALALRAFAEAGAVLDRDDWTDIARHCAGFLLRKLVRDGIVLRTWKDGEAKIIGFLEDASFLADALLVLYEATGEPRWFEEAERLARTIVDRFHDPELGYCDTASDAPSLLVRPRSLDDNPIPAGQSIAAQLFLRLHAFTGDQAWHERAMEILRPLAGAVARVPLALANVAAALDLALATPREIAVSGPREAKATRQLVRTVWDRFDPLRVLAWGDPGAVPLLQDRPLVKGRPAAYVCERFSCKAPVTTVKALAAQLP